MADIQVILSSNDMPRGLSFPSSPTVGMVFLRTDFRAFFQYDGSAWQQISTGSFTSFPGTPIDGLLIYRSDLHAHYIWFGAFGWLQTSIGLFTNAFPTPITGLRVVRGDTNAQYHYTGTVWTADTTETIVRAQASGIAQALTTSLVDVAASSKTVTTLGAATIYMTGIITFANAAGRITVNPIINGVSQIPQSAQQAAGGSMVVPVSYSLAVAAGGSYNVKVQVKVDAVVSQTVDAIDFTYTAGR